MTTALHYRNNREDEGASSNRTASSRANEDHDDEWTLADLYYSGHDDARVADARTTLRLVDEFHALWVAGPATTASTLLPWLRDHFEVDLDRFDWDLFDLKLQQEHCRIRKLNFFLHFHQIDDGTVRRKLADSARVLYSAKSLFVQMSRFLMTLAPQSLDRRIALPEPMRDDDIFRADTENIVDHDDAKLTNFQRALTYLVEVLEGQQLRRADSKLFKRVITPTSNLETLAFRELVSVADFVAQHTTHSFNYKEWRWITEPPKNFDHVVEYLSTRPLAEAPDLREDCHLRSYAGDVVGRGAGVYDCASDMFFPYVLRSNWDEMAQYVSDVRRRADPKYTCAAPSPSAVCVVHFDIAFPYDIFAEVCEQARVPVGLSWRNADEYECRHAADRLDAPALGNLLSTLLPPPHSKAELVECVVGLSWQRTFVAPPDDWTELHDGELALKLASAASTVVQVAGRDDGELECENVPLNSFIRVNVACSSTGGGGGSSHECEEWVYVPLCSPARRRRATLSVEQLHRCNVPIHRLRGRTHVSSAPLGCRWVVVHSAAAGPDGALDEVAGRVVDEFVHPLLASMLDDGKLEFDIDEWSSVGIDLTSSVFVRSRTRADVRYVALPQRHFRVDMGRTWLECDANEVDHIYICQKFTVHDRFMLYALKGRMFFEVGERDNHEITLFLEGVAGCGKSTVLKVQQQFWPPHLRGILSSNMQPQFGMSAVAKAKAIFCNEVSAELSIVQEEWQTSVSGEWGSYAVKFKEPLVLKWIAQHFWV